MIDGYKDDNQKSKGIYSGGGWWWMVVVAG